MVSQAEVNEHALGRDRLSTLLALTLTSATLFRFVELPTFSWGVRRLLGSPLGFTLGGEWLLSLLMIALVASGTFALLHEKVGDHRLPALLIGLITPSLTALAASLVLVRAASWPLWLGYLIGSGMLLGGVLALTDLAADSASTSYAWARGLLNLIDYFLAFGLYAAILTAQERALITAPLVFLLSGLVALDLLAPTGAAGRTLLLYAGVIAFIESEMAWVLSYWPLSPLTASAMLTAALYLMGGVAYQHLLGRLTRRLMLEFAFFSFLFLLLALIVVRP